jgi:hypothetical protein
MRTITITHPTAGSIACNAAAPDTDGNLWWGRVKGWDVPDVGSAVVVDRTYADGADLLDGYLPHRTYTIDGLAQCPGPVALRAAKARLAAVLNLLRVDGTLTVDDTPGARLATVRRAGAQADTEGLSLVWQATFVGGAPVRGAAATSSLNLTVPATGGLTWSATPPYLFTMAGASGTATNAGNAPAVPTVVVAASADMPGGIAVRNATTGLVVGLNGYTLLAGASLTFDFDKRTVRGPAGESLRAFLAPGSTWWTLQPGANDVAASAPGGAGTFAVTWRDAWV